jgi:uncharacterized SAM-binding protein YcdF (DUF218 family)
VVDDLNDAADRVRFAASLAHRFPATTLIISGGQAFDNGTARSESDALALMLEELGVARERLVLESLSRTTAENAALTAPRAGEGSWLLVTSAFHMPRAVGAFRQAGLSVIAAPVDWRVGDSSSLQGFDVIANLSKVNLVTKEYLGLLGYWITGRSTELLPGPGGHSCPGPAGV